MAKISSKITAAKQDEDSLSRRIARAVVVKRALDVESVVAKNISILDTAVDAVIVKFMLTAN